MNLNYRNEITMQSLKESVDKFLNFNEYKVLDNLGSVRKSIADDKAKAEYQTFNKTQKINSDFDKLLKLAKKK
ncbi:RhuM family protein [Psychromonas antarctica]|uniref:RhuM family protein n=1 Tax=Psychromonas antarctica TaxID=67573 RepID=UPI0023AEEE0B|nr:RhuM family protein [Psychromonas antarctica]